MDSVSKVILGMLTDVSNNIPFQKAEWMREQLEANELGVALDALLDAMVENEVRISVSQKERLEYCANQMRMDISSYLSLILVGASRG